MSAVGDLEEVHVQRGGPDAHGFRGERIATGAADPGVIEAHLGGDQFDERCVVLNGNDIPHRLARGLTLQMPLMKGQVLIHDADLVRSAHGDHRLLHAVLHALHDGGHRDQTGDAQHNPQHREQRAKLVGPDILQTDENGIEQFHRRRSIVL